MNEKLTSIPTSRVFLWPLRLFHGNPSCTSALVRAPSWCLQTRTTKGSWPACYRLDMRMQRSERQRPFLHKVIFRGVGRSEEDSVIPGWVGWRMRWSVSCRTSTSLSLILFSDVRFLPPPSFAFFFLIFEFRGVWEGQVPHWRKIQEKPYKSYAQINPGLTSHWRNKLPNQECFLCAIASTVHKQEGFLTQGEVLRFISKPPLLILII